jgi:hypothetical protein
LVFAGGASVVRGDEASVVVAAVVPPERGAAARFDAVFFAADVFAGVDRRIPDVVLGSPVVEVGVVLVGVPAVDLVAIVISLFSPEFCVSGLASRNYFGEKRIVPVVDRVVGVVSCCD